jgi:hypothetical protein
MTMPNALGLKEAPYPCRPAVRVALSVVLGLILVGMVTWRFLPYYKYSTLEEAVTQKQVVVGMNRGQVLKSWGAPYKIDVTYTDTGVRRELWVFEDWIDSATVKHRYLYFEEDALVGGWY